MDSFKEFMKKLTTGGLGAPFHVEQGKHSRPVSNPLDYLGASFLVQQGAHSGIPLEGIKEDAQVKEKLPTKGALTIRLHSQLHGALEGHHELHDELTGHYTPVHLTKEYVYHIRNFYTEDSSHLNTHLHEQFGHGHLEPEDHWQSVVRGIDKTLSLKPLHKPISVVSGLKKDVGMVTRQHQEKHGLPYPTLVHPAYMSTSLSFHTAANFATNINLDDDQEHHFLHAKLEPGQHGVYIGDKSNNPGEHEFLLPRRTIFKLHPVPSIHRWNSDVINRKGTFHVWHATVMNPDGKVPDK